MPSINPIKTKKILSVQYGIKMLTMFKSGINNEKGVSNVAITNIKL